MENRGIENGAEVVLVAKLAKGFGGLCVESP